MIKGRIVALMFLGFLCGYQETLGCDHSCEQYIQSAETAMESCLETMRHSLAPELPEDADAVIVDLFRQGFELGFSKGRIIRAGGDSDDLRMYLVCQVDLKGEVVAGDFFPYEHWPPKSDSESFIRTVGPYIEHFYGESRASSYSQGESAPLATLLFSIDGGEVVFSECVEVPVDWGD